MNDLLPIAVYGTLLTGEPNHPVLGGARLLGCGTLEVPSFNGPAEMWDTGYFPALTPKGADEHRPCPPPRVELFAVDAATRARLDRLEGTPTLFRRVAASVLLDGGVAVPAEVYVWADRGGDVCWRRIDGADWRARPERTSGRARRGA